MFFIWAIIVLIFICLLILYVGLQIALSIVTPKRRSLKKTRELENERGLGLMEFYDEKKHDECFIKSRYGYKLRLYFFITDNDSDKYVVMAHGHTYTHHGCIKYAKMMYERGYNVILYDERYHGNSGGNNTTLGYYEQNDLYDVITYVYERFGDKIFLGTYGESMGAAAVILEQNFDDRVKFVVSDSGFARLEEVLLDLMKRFKAFPKKPLLKLADFFVKIIAKMSIYDVNPIDSLTNGKTPILFVHGEDDLFIKPHESEEMFNRYNGPKMFFLGKNHAKHVGSYPNNVIEYEKTMDEFLSKYVDKLYKEKK